MLSAEIFLFVFFGALLAEFDFLIINIGLRIGGCRLVTQREYQDFKKQHEDQRNKDTKED